MAVVERLSGSLCEAVNDTLIQGLIEYIVSTRDGEHDTFLNWL
jgi:hypothetical protein